MGQKRTVKSKHGQERSETIRERAAMSKKFYFAISENNPCEVLIVIGGKPIHYFDYETPEIAKAVVDGQNNTPGRIKEKK